MKRALVRSMILCLAPIALALVGCNNEAQLRAEHDRVMREYLDEQAAAEKRKAEAAARVEATGHSEAGDHAMKAEEPERALKEYRLAEKIMAEWTKDQEVFDPAKIEEARAAAVQLARRHLAKAEGLLVPPSPSRQQQAVALTESRQLVESARSLVGPAVADNDAVWKEAGKFETTVWKPERLRQAVDALERAVEYESAHKEDATFGPPAALVEAIDRVEKTLSDAGSVPDANVVLARRALAHMREDVLDMQAADRDPSEAYRTLRKTAVTNLPARLGALKQRLPGGSPAPVPPPAAATTPTAATSQPVAGGGAGNGSDPDDLTSDLRVTPRGS